MLVVVVIMVVAVRLLPIALLGRRVVVVGPWGLATMATRRQTIRP